MICHQTTSADPDLEQASVHGPQAVDQLAWPCRVLGSKVAGLPSTRRVGGCDLDEARLGVTTARNPSVGVTSEFDDVLRSCEVEADVITWPLWTHQRVVRQALLAATRVPVEKPLAAFRALILDLVQPAECKVPMAPTGHTVGTSSP